MIESLNPILQGLLGTIFTWFVTAVGAATVFFLPSNMSEQTEGKVLDFALGFAGGVMLAASFWSLLDPALEMAELAWGESLSFFPVAIGFVAGALFVYGSDVFLPDIDIVENNGSATAETKAKTEMERKVIEKRQQKKKKRNNKSSSKSPVPSPRNGRQLPSKDSYRRILLLLIAVVLHNFPEGLAVGVAFGGIGSSKSATFEKARAIAIGIGLQNAPEGLAVSLPLRRLGWSKRKAFFYGQLSGMVEPLGGLLGAGAVTLAQPLLPYALSFAAGAMVYVVVDSVSPESHARGNGVLASWGCMLGFVVMMSMDVALG